MRVPLEQYQDALRSLRRGWTTVLVFQLWFTVLSGALFSPMLAWMLTRMVSVSGGAAVSNYDLTGFFLSAPGVAFLGVMAVLSVALMFMNQAGMQVIAGAIRERRRVSPLGLVWANLLRFRRLMAMGLWVLFCLVLLLMPCAGLLFLIRDTWLSAADINYYLATHPPEWYRAIVVAGLVLALFLGVGFWLLLRWSLAIQFVLFDAAPSLGALTASWRLTRGRWRELLWVLGLWWVGMTLVSILAGAVYTGVGHLLLDLVGLRLFWVVLLVAALFFGYLAGGILFAVIGGGVNALILSQYFFQHVGERVRFAMPGSESSRMESIFRRVAWGAVVVLSIGSAVSVSAAFSSARVDHQPMVTAHRGSSAAAPENSLSALRLAMEQGADYAEIDVQRTADGVIVLMHDADFMRIAGRTNKLADITLNAAREFDISGAFHDTYEGERLCTLQEVLDLVHGRMKLNIELKYNRPDANLAAGVVALVLQNGLENQCVITSLELKPLLEIEQRWPAMKTGLIVTAAVGDVTKTPVDFLSLNLSKATPAFVRLAHRRGKEVHVWTVNTEEQVHRTVEFGADNLITDLPGEVRSVLQFRSRLTPAERIALRLRNALLYGY